MILNIFNNYRGYHSYQNYECCDNTVVREQKIKWGFTPMDQSAHPSIHPSTKITKTIGVIRSYVVWTFSIVTVQKLPQLPTLPKYHTIFLNKHHGTYRATTERPNSRVVPAQCLQCLQLFAHTVCFNEEATFTYTHARAYNGYCRNRDGAVSNTFLGSVCCSSDK